MLKAIRSLPAGEQDIVLASLLDRALVGPGDRRAFTSSGLTSPPWVAAFQASSVGVTQTELFAHTLPWQRWGAALLLRRLAAGVTAGELASELGVDAELVRGTLSSLAQRPNVSERLRHIAEKLAEDTPLAQAAAELGIDTTDVAAELEPSDSLTNAVSAAFATRAALPSVLAGMDIAPTGQLRTLPVRFPERHYGRLKQWCEAHSFPMAVVVRGLVERFLDEQQPRGNLSA